MDLDRSTPPVNLFAENVEILDGQDESKPPALSQASVAPNAPLGPAQPEYPGGFAIDVCFEASKLPLDVAIFNSVRAAGGDDKIRKYLQAVLVVGGTARMAGMAHALESRSDICS
jgi:actin-related protein 8